MNNFGLYIHWPYCLNKCPYCDFASVRFCGKEDLLKAGYIRDIKQAPDGNLTSIYFGGGTPSLMSPRFFDFLMNFGSFFEVFLSRFFSSQKSDFLDFFYFVKIGVDKKYNVVIY